MPDSAMFCGITEPPLNLGGPGSTRPCRTAATSCEDKEARSTRFGIGAFGWLLWGSPVAWKEVQKVEEEERRGHRARRSGKLGAVHKGRCPGGDPSKLCKA